MMGLHEREMYMQSTEYLDGMRTILLIRHLTRQLDE